MASTDHVLLERWVDHRDAEAFKSICDRYAPMVYATCCRVLRNQSAAEDVTQDCFEALATATPPPKGHLGPWLHRVATYQALNRYRGDKRRGERERTYVERQADVSSLEWDDIHDLVDEAIEKLPEKSRVAVVGHFIEGKTHTAIAAELGVSRAAITQRIYRGIAGVRKHLKKQGVPIVATSLVVLLEAHLAEAAAVPATVQSTFGRIALSGVSCQRGVSAIGGIAMKTKVACAGAALLVALSAGVFLTLVNVSDETPTNVTDEEPRTSTRAVTLVVVAEEETPPAVDAVSNARPEVIPLEEQAIIEGIVTDVVGRPIAGALVFTRIQWIPPNPEKAVARTEEDGTFALSTLPDGTWMLAAWHPDFALGWTELSEKPTPEENAVIELGEGGRIAGNVYSGGRPVDDQAMSVQYMDDGPRLEFRAKTDRWGRYEVTHLPPGTPRVLLYPKWGGNNIDKLAVVEESRATVVDFELGSLGVPLAGKVLLADGPLSDGHVNISVFSNDGSQEEFNTKTSEDGHYSFEWLPLGYAILKVTAGDRGGDWQNYVRTFELTAAADNLIDVVISTESGSLACHVQIPDNHKVFYAAVLHGDHELTKLTIETILTAFAYKVAEPRLSTEGSFLLEKLEPGVYTVCVIVADATRRWQSENDVLANSLIATDVVEVVADELTETNLRLQ